jgi:hypothetical protein
VRHPQAGTGGHYYSHRGYYGYRHGGYHGYRHGGYYGYYRPYGYSSFYFGWPYYDSAWWPYGSAGYYYPPYYSQPYAAYGYDARVAPPAEGGGGYDEPEPQPSSRDTGRVRLEARPGDASVYVDDEFWGNARETKSLILRSGRHSIELVRPGFATVRRDVEVVRGETSDVLLELERQ